jgi:hypothetical protein
MARLSILTPSIRPQFLDRTQRTLEQQTFTDFEWLVEIGLRTGGFTLPSDMNRMLRRARGDIVLILQDCITVPPDALEKIAGLDHSRKAYTYPLQRIDDGGYDWRKYKAEATGVELTPNQWETDLASAPLSLFEDIGGYDEDFNNGWSWDNVEVAWRAGAAGYKFEVSRITEGKAFSHDTVIEHPFRNKRENNDKRANETRKRAERGDFKLSYLH